MEVHSLFELYSFWYPVSRVTSWGIIYYTARPYNLISSQTRPHGNSVLALVFTYVSFSTQVCSLKAVDTILPSGQTGLPSYLSLQVATLSIGMRTSTNHTAQIKSDRMNTNIPDHCMHIYYFITSFYITSFLKSFLLHSFFTPRYHCCYSSIDFNNYLLFTPAKQPFFCFSSCLLYSFSVLFILQTTLSSQITDILVIGTDESYPQVNLGKCFCASLHVFKCVFVYLSL